jgi:uncharacterized protein
MPVQTTIPGVYVQEFPSGPEHILGVSTSVCAFVGNAKRGPINKAVTVSSYSDFERRFGGLSADSEMSYAVHQFFINGGSNALVVRLVKSSTTSILALKDDTDIDDVLLITALDEGVAGNSVRISVDYANVEAISFNLTIEFIMNGDPINGLKETFANIYMTEEHPRSITRMVNGISQLVTCGILKDSRPKCCTAFLDKGSEVAFTEAEASSIYLGNRTNREGIYALDNVDIFNLLCLPGIADSEIIMYAVDYCKVRRAFMIVDSPKSISEPADIITLMSSDKLPKTEYGAIYYPWIKIADPLIKGDLRSCAPCGTIAGLYARIDSNRGVWHAPAGPEATLIGVEGVNYRLSDLERSYLNSLGVNCIRIFPGFGVKAWGARTLRGADQLTSDYKYVPVKRLALFLEESLYQGFIWIVFEPNDESLWSRIRLYAGAFMHDLYIQPGGAFCGASPKEAYFVKCDKETTTQNDIDRGVVNIWVGFAPLRPAEFIILHIQQIACKIND